MSYKFLPAFWMAHGVWGLMLVVLIPCYSLHRSTRGLHRSARGLQRSAKRSVEVCADLHRSAKGSAQVCIGLHRSAKRSVQVLHRSARGLHRSAHVCEEVGPSFGSLWIFGSFGGHRLRPIPDFEIDFDKGKVNLGPSPKWKSVNNSFHSFCS